MAKFKDNVELHNLIRSALEEALVGFSDEIAATIGGALVKKYEQKSKRVKRQ